MFNVTGLLIMGMRQRLPLFIIINCLHTPDVTKHHVVVKSK